MQAIQKMVKFDLAKLKEATKVEEQDDHDENDWHFEKGRCSSYFIHPSCMPRHP